MTMICNSLLNGVYMVLVVCVITMTSGCSNTTDSGDIKTTGINAEIEVFAHDDRTGEVQVTLTVGSSSTPNHLRLSNGDRLVATVEGQTYQLSEVEGLTGSYYKTSLPHLDGGTLVKLSLLREEDPSPENSNVTLSQPFEIDQPVEGTTITEDTPVTFTWIPSGANEKMWLLSTYECQKPTPEGGAGTHEGAGGYFNLIDDHGTVTYTVADLLGESKPSEKFELGCSRIAVKIVRETNGTVDPAYRSGEISAKLERIVNLRYEPN